MIGWDFEVGCSWIGLSIDEVVDEVGVFEETIDRETTTGYTGCDTSDSVGEMKLWVDGWENK